MPIDRKTLRKAARLYPKSSISKLANQLEVNRESLRLALIRAGVEMKRPGRMAGCEPSRKKHSMAEARAKYVIRAFKRGDSAEQIAKHLNVSAGTIWSDLRYHRDSGSLS